MLRQCLPRYVAVCVAVLGLQGQAPPPAEGQSNTSELAFHDTPATFRTKVNLVLVPVVVRDKAGNAVGNLRKEDFQLYDRGKIQSISSFTVETRSGQTAAPVKTEPAAEGNRTEEAPAPSPAEMPNRYVIYLFDDVHTTMGDLMQVRNAAGRYMDDALVPADRAAIFSTSGRTMLDFTDDKARLHATLLKLIPNPIASTPVHLCPDITYYQADLIQDQNDPMALQAAIQDAMACMSLDPREPSSLIIATDAAKSTAAEVWQAGDAESRYVINGLRDAIRRLSVAPGQRSVILISPGVLTLPDLQSDKTDVIDRAIRSNVMISSLNARGLYTIVAGADPDHPIQSPTASAMKIQYNSASALAEDDFLAEVAYGTGGVFFHNNNDLLEGFKRVAARPEYVYVLGFAPQSLKLDGTFHPLKVTVSAKKVELQARRGYFAPAHLADPAETAKEEIRDAMFSREELRDIPLQMRTQFFKSGVDEAKLAVLAHVDVRVLHFRKENGRNADNLVVASGIFDRNGNLITGNEKTLEMHLKDQTLEGRLSSGITIRSSFDVKPGSYVIRLVVRDSEGELMAAANGAVDIPIN
ncbi:MAG TPA: VWA domain-containing protein [Bryobacteraceae bacterium]|nr:VWA domain-containing protein [Bryobacteraceae bacterium]